MKHLLVDELEKAFGWSGADGLGREFVRGEIADLGLCRRLVSPTKILDIVMRRSLATPQVRCFRDGLEVHSNSYLGLASTRHGKARQYVDMEKLGGLLKSGCTLILDALETFDPTMEVANRALQWWSRELVQVNAYLTTQATAGFALHWDDHDVIIVQLAGEKEWEVREPSRRWPMYRDAQPNDTPSDEIVWTGVTRPGDVLHIPRGHWHRGSRADSGDGFSLHLTFGFTKRTGVDWLSWLADRAREEDVFRQDLLRTGEDADQAQADLLAEAAHRLLTTRRPADFLIAREQEQRAPRRITTWGIFGPVEHLVCLTAFPPRIDTDGANVIVYAAGKKITFAGRALPPLRMLLSGAPVHLREVSDATGVNAAPLAEVLLREGICAEVTPELFLGYTGLVAAEPF
jgi:Cupin superfamily protein